MGGHVQPRVSVLVPARNEERTLPTTLPTILEAANELVHPAEVLVITPPTSPVVADPPVRDVRLRWHITPQPGKFHALRVGADAARGEILLLVDADVVVDVATFRLLAQPILDGSADVVAGRLELLPGTAGAAPLLLERWASISFTCWDQMRTNHPDLLWALPGAIYGIRRSLLPARPLVPIVDDASIGLQAKETGATFAYVRDATVRTPAPASYRHWLRQKLRSRRGWAALARLRPTEVTELEAVYRRYLSSAAQDEPTGRLMRAQDRLLRFAARQLLRLERSPADAWDPARAPDQWLDSPLTGPRA